MKKLLTIFFVSIGVIVTSVVALAVAAALFKAQRAPQNLPDRMVLELSLDNGLKEAPPRANLPALLGQPPAFTLQQIVRALDRARLDSRVAGLSFHMTGGDYPAASSQELRDAVLRFRQSGKFAALYADDLGSGKSTTEYRLASAFGEIWLHPLSELAINAYAVEIPFARGLLDKIGVKGEIQHAGKYKSYPESIMRSSASDDNAEMTKSLLNDLQVQLEKDIAAGRKIEIAAVRNLIAEAPIAAEDALKAKLIDRLGYYDEFEAALEQKAEGAENVDLALYGILTARNAPGQKMALINVNGALTTANGAQAMAHDIVSAEEIVEALRDAAEEPSFKAILIRLDSPGGTPLAADMIRRAIELARAQKPVVISMSNTAASGGYWMSVAANTIVAQPSTLTGSIGVFGGKIDVSELWEKLGVNWQRFPEDASTDLWSINAPYSVASSAKRQAAIDRTYAQFLKIVANGRKMKVADVEQMAQGRVWTGAQAKELGLVDTLGGLDTAISAAKALTKIPENAPVALILLPKPLTPVEQLVQLLGGGGLPLRLMKAEAQASLDALFLSAAPTIR
jgi:protease-4